MQKTSELLAVARREFLKRSAGEVPPPEQQARDLLKEYTSDPVYANRYLPAEPQPLGRFSVLGPSIANWWSKAGPNWDESGNRTDSLAFGNAMQQAYGEHPKTFGQRMPLPMVKKLTELQYQDLNRLRREQVGAGLGSLADLALWSATTGAAHGAYQHGKKLLALRKLDKPVSSEDEDEAVEKLSAMSKSAGTAPSTSSITGSANKLELGADKAVAGNAQSHVAPGPANIGAPLSGTQAAMLDAAGPASAANLPRAVLQDILTNSNSPEARVGAWSHAGWRLMNESPSLTASLPYGMYIPAAMGALAIPYIAAYKGTGWLADKFRAAGIKRRKLKAVQEFQGLLSNDLHKQSEFGKALDKAADDFAKEAYGPEYRTIGGIAAALMMLEAMGGFQVGKRLAVKMDPLRDRKAVLDSLLQKRRAAKPMRLQLEPGTAGDVVNDVPESTSDLSPGVYQTPTALPLGRPGAAPVQQDEMHDLTKLSLSTGFHPTFPLTPASPGAVGSAPTPASSSPGLFERVNGVIDRGLDRATGLWDRGVKHMGRTLASGAAEGVQDAASKGLYDLSKGVINFGKKIGDTMSNPFSMLEHAVHTNAPATQTQPVTQPGSGPVK